MPDWLVEPLRIHRDTHGPHYQGHLSDHLPMALLAMWAVGVRRSDLERYAARYRGRLDPPARLARRPPVEFADAVGHIDAYGSLLAFFDGELERLGMRRTLTTWLPRLASGWVRFAFHPIIRLAYGIRFEVGAEVAAGLAYLASAGPDPALEVLANTASPGEDLSLPPPGPALAEPFEQRYNATVASGALEGRVVVLPDHRRRVAEVGLALFNDTHDFFALHVVTGTHALGVCADAIGLDSDGLLSAGFLAAYATIGAPRFDRAARPAPASVDDEHDAKLAFTCIEQSRLLDSGPYRDAAAVYAAGGSQLSD
ncbi:MAG: questin oxidase family protein [Gammaproteobacteria bacterium]|nr:questin oxidase family protein [Gammaproteobacteria bacterium]